jgi:hypothetical protein
MKKGYEDAGDRIAEDLWSTYGEAIHSQETFNEKWEEKYQPTESMNRELRPLVFQSYIQDHPIAGRIEAEEFAPSQPPKKQKRHRVAPKKPSHRFNYSGYIHKRLVYARPTRINQRYKKGGVEYRKLQVKFRDKTGRFVKLFGKSKIKPENIKQ